MSAIKYGTKIINFIVIGLADIWFFINGLWTLSLSLSVYVPEYIFGCSGKHKYFSLFYHHGAISIYNLSLFSLFNL